MSNAAAYPPPSLIPTGRRRITALPSLAFAGLIESAPISWEEASKARDIANHHHVQHRIDHDFGGNVDAYRLFVERFGDVPKKSGTKEPAFTMETSSLDSGTGSTKYTPVGETPSDR